MRNIYVFLQQKTYEITELTTRDENQKTIKLLYMT